MTGAWIILGVTIAIGLLLWMWEKFRTQRHGPTLHHHGAAHVAPDDQKENESPNGETQETANAVCCGLHAICEKTGQINEPPVYYDDDELDRFAGRGPEDYTDNETEEFRDVLLTLMPSDAAGWALSLEKRRINLPSVLKPELELLLCES